MTRENIQSIASPQSCRSFFASLGFDDGNNASLDKRATQALYNNLHPRPLTSGKVQEFDLIARRKDTVTGQEFTCLLYVVPTIKQSLAKEIFRQLARNSNNFIFVLADPSFDTIEIVYVDNYATAAASLNSINGIALQQTTLPGTEAAKPSTRAVFRSLSFSRRDIPLSVVRTLNRFRWPAVRGIALQTQILSSAFNAADWSEDYFTNHALFSDHYLRENLNEMWSDKQSPESAASGEHWRGLINENEFSEGWLRLKERYEDAADTFTEPKNSTHTRTDSQSDAQYKGLLEETFTILGFSYQGSTHNKSDITGTSSKNSIGGGA